MIELRSFEKEPSAMYGSSALVSEPCAGSCQGEHASNNDFGLFNALAQALHVWLDAIVSVGAVDGVRAFEKSRGALCTDP